MPTIDRQTTTYYSQFSIVRLEKIIAYWASFKIQMPTDLEDVAIAAALRTKLRDAYG